MADFAHQLVRVATCGVLWFGVTTGGFATEYQKIVDRKVVYQSPDRKTQAIVV
jgi:hypothetical protein